MPFGVHIDLITSMANLEGFFCPPGTPGPPPVHPRGNFHQTDFPPLSCSVLRVPALLRPHPSGAPAGDSGWEWYHSLPDFETAGVDFGEGAHASLSNETRLQAKGHLLTA